MGKLDPESQNALICGLMIYEENNVIRDIFDFSGAVMLLSKALETELRKYFMNDYIQYLKQKAVKEEDFPEAVKDTINNHFVIGSVEYILGYECKPEWQLNTDKRKADKDVLYEYLKTRFAVGTNAAVNERIRNIYNTVSKIRLVYRNPATHEESVDYEECEGFIDYLLFKDRSFQRMMELFVK